MQYYLVCLTGISKTKTWGVCELEPFPHAAPLPSVRGATWDWLSQPICSLICERRTYALCLGVPLHQLFPTLAWLTVCCVFPVSANLPPELKSFTRPLSIFALQPHFLLPASWHQTPSCNLDTSSSHTGSSPKRQFALLVLSSRLRFRFWPTYSFILIFPFESYPHSKYICQFACVGF